MDHTACTFSSRAQKLTSSAIREVLKITERPEIISFAGGLPAPVIFPVEAIQAVCARMFVGNPQASLQYTPTEGLSVLRGWIAQRHGITAPRVLVTTGSQQSLDLLSKIFIDPQSKMLVETPTYLDALRAFSLFEPTCTSIATDDRDLLPDALAPELTAGAHSFYAIPNFQNPTGRRLPLDRRQVLVARAKELSVLLIKDSPHDELSYTGDALPLLRSLNPDGVVYMGSFSKTLAPDIRLGYIIAPEHIHFKPVQTRQALDLHTLSFTQRVTYEMLETGLLDAHIPGIRNLYGKQCKAMLDSLARHVSAGAHWNRPEGGMFIWMEVPEGIDMMALLEKAVARSVAFVPGASFYANAPRRNTFHLMFVTMTPERIKQGITMLGRLIRAEIAALAPKAA